MTLKNWSRPVLVRAYVQKPGGEVLNVTECAYALRYVVRNNRPTGPGWSIRQTVTYHRYNMETRSSSWVFVAPSVDAEEQLSRYLTNCSDLSISNPFEFHLILLDIALATWRPYIVQLTETIKQQVFFLTVFSNHCQSLQTIVGSSSRCFHRSEESSTSSGLQGAAGHKRPRRSNY